MTPFVGSSVAKLPTETSGELRMTPFVGGSGAKLPKQTSGELRMNRGSETKLRCLPLGPPPLWNF